MNYIKRGKVLERWDSMCYFCGEPICKHFDRWNIHHIIPRHCLGNNKLYNLAPSHVECHDRHNKEEMRVKGLISYQAYVVAATIYEEFGIDVRPNKKIPIVDDSADLRPDEERLIEALEVGAYIPF